MVDRIQSSHAAKMLGVSKRQITLMANRGDLPGAAKIGSLWTFDPEKLTRWIEEREDKCLRNQKKISSKEEKYTTYVSGLTDASVNRAYERAISLLRNRGAINS